MLSTTRELRLAQGTFYLELQSLSGLPVETHHRKTPFGLIIRVRLPEIFDIHLEDMYPDSPPRVLTETPTEFPSVADGRDLLAEVLPQQWQPSTTTVEIIQLLPAFLKRKLSPDAGKYHLGSRYYLETWDNKPNMACFFCADLTPTEGDFMQEKVFVVTHQAVLQLLVDQDYPGVGRLVSWATLDSLKTIRRSMTEPFKLAFHWKAIGESPPYSQTVSMPEADRCISLIAANAKQFSDFCKHSSEDFTGKALHAVDIEALVQRIAELEQARRPEQLQTLVVLYTQAIEYCSAVDDPRFGTLLQGMHHVLNQQAGTSQLAAAQSVESQQSDSDNQLEVDWLEDSPEARGLGFDSSNFSSPDAIDLSE